MAGYIGTKAVLLSTTAASVTGNADIGGDLTVDTSTLFVDSTNNRVGIETTSPDGKLDIALGSMDIVAGLGGNFPMWTYRNGSGSWFHAGKHPTDDAFIVATGATPTSTERMRIDASGNLLVRMTSNPDLGVLVVNQDASTNNVGISTVTSSTATRYHLLFRNGNGQVGGISTNGSSTFFNTSSDYRLKEDVQPMSGASDRVLALTPINFAWKADGTRVDGFLAHEAQAVVPEAVTGTKDAVDADGNPVYQGIDQSKLVPLLTAALQEALNEIAALKDRVAALETV